MSTRSPADNAMAREAILASTSLQDLLDDRDQRLQSQVMYFI